MSAPYSHIQIRRKSIDKFQPDPMARKKKKNKSKPSEKRLQSSKVSQIERAPDERLEEELEALKAIYEEHFQILEDKLGCSVLIVSPKNDHQSVSAAYDQARLSILLEARYRFNHVCVHCQVKHGGATSFSHRLH